MSNVTGSGSRREQATTPTTGCATCARPVRFARRCRDAARGRRPRAARGRARARRSRARAPAAARRARVVCPRSPPPARTRGDLRTLLETAGPALGCRRRGRLAAPARREPRRRLPLPTLSVRTRATGSSPARATPRPPRRSTLRPGPHLPPLRRLNRDGQRRAPAAPARPDSRASGLENGVPRGPLRSCPESRRRTSTRDATFLELGFDSLFLTQASQELRTRVRRQARLPSAARQEPSTHPRAAARRDVLPEAEPAPGRSPPRRCPRSPLPRSPASAAAPGRRRAGASRVPPARSSSACCAAARDHAQQLQLVAAARAAAGRAAPRLAEAVPAAVRRGTRPPRRRRRLQPPASRRHPASAATLAGRSRPSRRLGRRAHRAAAALPRRLRRPLQRRTRELQGAHTRRPRPARRSARRRGLQPAVEGDRLPDRRRPLRGSRSGTSTATSTSTCSTASAPNILGHSPDFVLEAHAASSSTQGIEIGPQTPLAGEVARARLRAHRQGARRRSATPAPRP